jgi:predicted Ser/Thr protein kinase
VLERLTRIEALERTGAPPGRVLEELRALVGEAEVWARREGGDVGTRAAERLRDALARDMIEA